MVVFLTSFANTFSVKYGIIFLFRTDYHYIKNFSIHSYIYVVLITILQVRHHTPCHFLLAL